MRRRTAIILVGVLAVGGMGASLAAVFKPFEGGPRYRGMPCSYWKRVLFDNEAHHTSLITRLETFIGLRDKSGLPAIYYASPSEALPIMFHLYRDDNAQVRGLVWPWFNAVCESLRTENADNRRQLLKGLRDTGPEAAPVAYLVESLLQDESVATEAAEALRQIDAEAAERAGVK
jgi:hypothetical protein